MKKIFKIQKSNTSFFIHISEPLVGNDVNSYCINIEFDEELQDAQLIICAMRADGEIITDSAIITGREALYTLKNNMYSVPGEVNIRLRVVNGGMMLTEKQLIFTTLEGYGEGSTADDRLPVLENLIVEAQKATAEAREAAERVPEMEGDIRENPSAIEAIDKSLENGDFEAAAVKSHTVLKNNKVLGWVKFATMPYSRGWRSENALIYINSHYVESKFAALIYVGLQPDGADYHTDRGIVLKQIAGDDISDRLAYYKNPDTKEITIYYNKHAYATLNISTVFSNITGLSFEPANDACEVLNDIDVTGRAVYMINPMTERDSEGNIIKNTYATKEQLSEKVTYKGTEEISLLPTNGNNAGDMYKLIETITIPKYRYLSSGELVYNSWYADFDGDGVDELVSDGTGFDSGVGDALLTSKEIEEYDYQYVPYPINIYDANKEFIKSTSMFYAGEISTWRVNDTSGLTLGETYYIERADGVTPDGIEPETIGETTTVKDNGYALYNGEAFDKLYTQDMVDEKIAETKQWKTLIDTTLTEYQGGVSTIKIEIPNGEILKTITRMRLLIDIQSESYGISSQTLQVKIGDYNSNAYSTILYWDSVKCNGGEKLKYRGITEVFPTEKDTGLRQCVTFISPPTVYDGANASGNVTKIPSSLSVNNIDRLPPYLFIALASGGIMAAGTRILLEVFE